MTKTAHDEAINGSAHLKELQNKLGRIAEQNSASLEEMAKLIEQRIEIEAKIAKITQDIADASTSRSKKQSENVKSDKDIDAVNEDITIKKLKRVTAVSFGISTATMDWGVFSGPATATALARYTDQINELKGKRDKLINGKHNIPAIDAEIAELNQTIQAHTKDVKDSNEKHIPLAEQKRIYSAVIDKIEAEQAMAISLELNRCAVNSGTTIDNVLSAIPMSREFANLPIGRENLDAAIDWARAEKGKFDGVSSEELSFRQFINHVVIPNQDYFEILASKSDDLKRTGREGFPLLEILRQKPISLSGRRLIATQEPELGTEEEKARREKLAKAAETAEQRIPVLDLSNILISPGAAKENLTYAITKSEEQLEGIKVIFSDIESRIDDLISTSKDAYLKMTAKKAERDEMPSAKKLDEQIDALEFDIKVKEATTIAGNKSRMGTAAGISIATKLGTAGIKRAAEGAVAGTVVPGVGTVAGGVAGGAWGIIEGLLDVIDDSAGATGITAAAKASMKIEVELKREFIQNLREQKVDVEAKQVEIDKIWEDIKEKAASKEMQELISDSVKSQQVVKAFLANTILVDGRNNMLELEQCCEEHGIGLVNDFLSSFKGRTGEALLRFSFGVANSNDMKVIIAEANSLKGDDLTPAEQSLKSLVEDVIKPFAGSYLARASKIDKVYQANLLGFGTPLHWEREMVRDSTDLALGALFANEFGMSSVGVQDVRNLFDFHLHRHGDDYLYDAKLKDGQMSDSYPKKLVDVVSEDKMDGFVKMVGVSAAHRRSSQPDVGDMFLRVCGYEYFMPQAVQTAGTNNLFSENPEAPAAYPMVNDVINDFIKRLSLSPIEKYREQVGERLDNLVAQSFIDFFAKLGEIHATNPKIVEHRQRLHDTSLDEKYAPNFASFTRRITGDATQRFDMFLDIYQQNLEKTLELSPERARTVLEGQITQLEEPTRTMLFPDVVKPDSHRARLQAHYENHSFENMSRRAISPGM